MKKIIKKIIYKLENYPLSFNNFILTLLSIAFIRSFFEGLLEKKRVIGHILTTNYYDSLRHNLNFWTLEWLAMFSTLVLIFYIFTKENLIKISKVLLFSYPVIILPVILDYFIYFPFGSEITYFYTSTEYMNALLNFFNFKIEIPKASLGVRIEVLIAVLLSFIYIYTKKNNFLIALIGTLTVYFMAISSMAFPVFILLPIIFFLKNHDAFIFNFFSNINFPYDSESKVAIFIIFYLLFILFLLSIIYNKKLVKQFLTVIINKHIIYFNILIFLYGVLAAAKQNFIESKTNIFHSSFTIFYILSGIFLIFFISLIFLLLNNDENTDLKKSLSKYFDLFLFIFILLSLFLSISISYPVFLINIFVFSLFVLLFKNPFNLYKIFIFKIIIYSLLSCIFVLLGFAFIYGIYAPQKITFTLTAILFLLFLSLHFLANTEEKILNIVSLFLILFSYLISGILLLDNKLIFVFAILSGLITVFFSFINKKEIGFYILILFLLSISICIS